MVEHQLELSWQKNEFIKKNHSLNLAFIFLDFKKTTPLKKVGQMKYECVLNYIIENLRVRRVIWYIGSKNWTVNK